MAAIFIFQEVGQFTGKPSQVLSDKGTTRWNYSQCLLQLRNLWCWNHGWGFAEKGFGDSLKVTFHFREQFTSIHWESSQFRCLEPLRKIFWLISNGSLLVFLVCRPHTWKKTHHGRNCNFTQKQIQHSPITSYAGTLGNSWVSREVGVASNFFRDARFTAWHIASTFMPGKLLPFVFFSKGPK